MNRPCQALLALVLFSIFLSAAQADIIVLAPTGTTLGSVQITQPITFTITTGGNVQVIALDDWVTSDGSNSGSPYSPSISISLNGQASFPASGSLVDNLDQISGALTPGDGYFFISGAIFVSTNDTFILESGTYTLGLKDGFNPQATQTFTGNMFLTNVNGARLSNDVSAVPEPSACALGLLGCGAVLLAIRRRARFAESL